VTGCELIRWWVASRQAVRYSMGTGGGIRRNHRQTMTAVILAQSSEFAAWQILPGSYANFEEARSMVQFICSSFSAGTLFAIEHADDVSRKGYKIA
jgi:hypothetical protein